MALMQVQFLSMSLRRTVPFQLILPADKISTRTQSLEASTPFKTLYLLHGLLGNCSDWITHTTIQQLADERNLAVVMPSGDNSFYIPQRIPNQDYGAFVGQELVEMTRRMFPLSHKREDTFIAGLSMGGFGALRNGFCYAENFGAIAGFSSAIHFFETPQGETMQTVFHEDAVFGDLQEAAKSDKNPRVAFMRMKERLVAKRLSMPKIYMACGTEDTLVTANRSFRDFLLENHADLTYVEESGHHDWVFWQKQIERLMDWLPLSEAASGLSSGHVVMES